MITFHIHKHLMRPYAQFTRHAPSHGQMACVPYAAAHSTAKLSIAGPMEAVLLATPNGEPSHWPSMAGRVATATALGSRDCHHIEATAAPAQMHRSCSAPPLSNAGAEPQASIERGMIARARGENEHAVGAGRPQDWRLRLGCSPIGAWRPWQRSRFAHLRRDI